MNCGNHDPHEAHAICTTMDCPTQCDGVSNEDAIPLRLKKIPGTRQVVWHGNEEVTYVPLRPVGAGDSLYEMIQRQTDFQGSLGRHFEFMDDEEKITYIKEQVLACLDELHEALNEVGWKSWASSRHINRDAFVNELIDAWHFLMNLFIVAEVPPHEIFTRYIEKNDKNWLRQKHGYDGVSTKCPGCKRAFDDDAVQCYPVNQANVLPNIVAYCDHIGEYVSRQSIDTIPIDQYFEDNK